jgi:hypothetical protein
MLYLRNWFYAVAASAFGATATAQDAEPADSLSPPAVETPPRMDPKYPLKIAPKQYMAPSLHLHEGTCAVRAEVDSAGFVRATQLISTSGSAEVDAFCLEGFARARLLPATMNGKPVTTWANVPIAWNIPPHTKFHAQRMDDDQITIPIIEKNYELKVEPSDYPVAARAKHQEGDCTIHVFVNETLRTAAFQRPFSVVERSLLVGQRPIRFSRTCHSAR